MPRRGHKLIRSWRIVLALGCVALMVGAGSLLWPGPSPRPPKGSAAKSASPPPYVEPQPKPSPADALQRLDEAVFAALRSRGFGFKRIKVRVRPGPRGSLTMISVRLAPGQRPGRELAALKKALAKASAATRRRGPGLEVYLGDRLTHGITFLLAPPRRPLPPEAAKPQLALVIDDLGYDLAKARRVLALKLNLTLSVLPKAPFAAAVARLARKKGRQVLVHLPMEPKGFPKVDPGPGALLRSMNPSQLTRVTEANLALVPFAVGANNHMGSSLTEDAVRLKPILLVLKARGFFFLDSLTSPRSQAYAVAHRLGLLAGQREVFLDHDQGTKAVEHQLKLLLGLAARRGRAIGIAHPYASTLAVLGRRQGWISKQVELVPVSMLLSPPAAIRP